MRVMPRQPAPNLDVATVGHDRWALGDRHPTHFSLTVFYRGLHCPVCRPYLSELNRLVGEFDRRGVEVVAISSDDAVRAAQAVRDCKLDALALGHGLSIATARAWVLYISTGHGKTSAGVEEPPKFAEPGIFLIPPDSSVYFASVQTMPFARPNLSEVLSAVDFILKNGSPARGEA